MQKNMNLDLSNKDDQSIRKSVKKLISFTSIIFKMLGNSDSIMEMPPMAINFMAQTFKNRSTVPVKLLDKFELNYIDVDEFQCFYNLTVVKQMFLTLYFVICKILVDKLMYDKNAFELKISRKVFTNIKIIGSFIYYISKIINKRLIYA